MAQTIKASATCRCGAVATWEVTENQLHYVTSYQTEFLAEHKFCREHLEESQREPGRRGSQLVTEPVSELESPTTVASPLVVAYCHCREPRPDGTECRTCQLPLRESMTITPSPSQPLDTPETLNGPAEQSSECAHPRAERFLIKGTPDGQGWSTSATAQWWCRACGALKYDGGIAVPAAQPITSTSPKQLSHGSQGTSTTAQTPEPGLTGSKSGSAESNEPCIHALDFGRKRNTPQGRAYRCVQCEKWLVPLWTEANPDSPSAISGVKE